MVEALALKHDMELAWMKGYKHLNCKLNCRELLSILGEPINVDFFPVAVEIGLLARDWVISSLDPIPRESNVVVDCMEKEVVSTSGPGFTILDSPFVELEIVLLGDSLFFSKFLVVSSFQMKQKNKNFDVC